MSARPCLISAAEEGAGSHPCRSTQEPPGESHPDRDAHDSAPVRGGFSFLVGVRADGLAAKDSAADADDTAREQSTPASQTATRVGIGQSSAGL